MRIMLRTKIAALALLTLIASPSAQAQETGKRVGEKLDQVGQDIRGGLNRAGEEVKEQFAAAKSSVQSMGVEARVYSRLHWDKALNGATIELTLSKAGVVTLKGSVASTKAREKAVELATDTVGVTGVVDQLAVQTKVTRLSSEVVTPASRP